MWSLSSRPHHGITSACDAPKEAWGWWTSSLRVLLSSLEQRICSNATSFMASYFKDLLSKASQSEHPLAAFADPELYLERRQRFLDECQPTLKRLVQAVTIIPRISWEDFNEARITVGTLMATRLNIWIAAGG